MGKSYDKCEREAVKARADRTRDYCEDPSIGLERVEKLLDAAHALSINCHRNPAIRKLRPEEQRQRRLEAAAPRPDPFSRLHRPPDRGIAALSRQQHAERLTHDRGL